VGKEIKDQLDRSGVMSSAYGFGNKQPQSFRHNGYRQSGSGPVSQVGQETPVTTS